MILDWIKSVLKSKTYLFDDKEKADHREVPDAEERLDRAMRDLEAAARRAGVSDSEMKELKKQVRAQIDPLRAMSEDIASHKRGK